MTPEPEPRRKRSVHVHKERQAKLEYFYTLPQLFDSGIRYNGEGDIFYTTKRKLSKDGLLSPDFIQVFPTDSRVDSSAPHTRYPVTKQEVVNLVSEDGGSVEGALRIIDHVILGETDTQISKVVAVKQHALELAELFGQRDFSKISDGELIEARKKTEALLGSVGLDPSTVLGDENEQLKSMLLKASLGRDSLERRNRLITITVLAAAYRRAMAREREIAGIAEKFFTMRGALIQEQMINRYNFAEIARLLDPRRLPGDVVFEKRSPPSARDKHRVIRLLGNMRDLLSQTHLKTYRTVAIEANKMIDQAIELLVAGDRHTLTTVLFPDIRSLLLVELTRQHS